MVVLKAPHSPLIPAPFNRFLVLHTSEQVKNISVFLGKMRLTTFMPQSKMLEWCVQIVCVYVLDGSGGGEV